MYNGEMGQNRALLKPWFSILNFQSYRLFWDKYTWVSAGGFE